MEYIPTAILQNIGQEKYSVLSVGGAEFVASVVLRLLEGMK